MSASARRPTAIPDLACRSFASLWIPTVAVVLACGCAGRLPWQNRATTNEHLRTLKSSADPSERLEAFAALGEPARYKRSPERQQEAVHILRLGLELEKDQLVRITIVHSLAALKGEQAQAALLASLHDKDAVVRAEICRALARLGDPASSEAIAKLLASDSNLDVRLAAADALGHLRTSSSAQALLAALDDKDPALRHRASRSLRAITGKDYGTDFKAWQAYLSDLPEDALARSRFLGVL